MPCLNMPIHTHKLFQDLPRSSWHSKFASFLGLPARWNVSNTPCVHTLPGEITQLHIEKGFSSQMQQLFILTTNLVLVQHAVSSPLFSCFQAVPRFVKRTRRPITAPTILQCLPQSNQIFKIIFFLSDLGELRLSKNKSPPPKDWSRRIWVNRRIW